MEHTLILCGGTGAHVGAAFLRLHTLGQPLGFFDRGERAFLCPEIFLVDQDSGDGSSEEPTAWQLVKQLIYRHPGRLDWEANFSRPEPIEPTKVSPLPIGSNNGWYKPPHSTLKTRFDASSLLPGLTSERQRQIDYSKGMMGSPAVGSLLFKLKEYDERERGINHDERFGELFKTQGLVVVAGSGVGGTGASVGPTLAHQLSQRSGNRVMALTVLNWFEFDEDDVDDERRERAALRNRAMRQNANSALEFYGQRLADGVAAVPVGMPERSYLRRRFTSDVGQPVRESYVHAVAALAASRHYLNPKPYGPGLYVMGAVERGRLDGSTAIPGGTLQGLANQAATLAELLETWRRVLVHPHQGRVIPAIYEAVERVAEPTPVAEELADEIAHLREQLGWMKEVLDIDGTPDRSFSRELVVRQRLTDPQSSLELREGREPEEVALGLYYWTARWIREAASASNRLAPPAGEVDGGHWPDLQNPSIGVAAQKNGDLTRISDADIAVVLESFVDRRHLSANGWPHPLAAADYFRQALDRRDSLAFRQLELLLAGLVTGLFELRRLELRAPSDPVSLEHLLAECRRVPDGFPGLAEMGVFFSGGDRRMIGFNSPHTLLCSVPFMDDAADHRLWQGIWETLSGAADGTPWSEASGSRRWPENDLVVGQIRSWIEHQKQAQGGNPPPWTRVFEDYPSTGAAVPFGAGPSVSVFWGSSSAPNRPLVGVSLPTSDTDARWIPPTGTPVRDERELLKSVPEFRVLKDAEGRELFSMVTFEIPEREEEVHGWWDEHLNELRQQGRIHIWSRTEDDGLIVGTLRDNVLHQTTFESSRVLDRKSVTISTCTPFVQNPVDSSHPKRPPLYPDLPVHSDYLDLVKTPDGAHLGELLRTGGDIRGSWRPTTSRDSQGLHLVRWSVHLRGRSSPMPVEVRLSEEPGHDNKDSHRAHWMVWPRFRTRSGDGWRSYYVYENCSDPRLFCDILWLQGTAEHGKQRLRCRRHEGREHGGFPVSFRASAQEPAHEGGPPVALCARFHLPKSQEEQGLYLVPLEVVGPADVDLKIGIDFGTSHSVAALQLAGAQSQQVALLPELHPENAKQALTLHISEDRGHLKDPENEFGLLAMGNWLPTYREVGTTGFLPSELLLSRPLKEARAESAAEWTPVRDVTIPPLDLARSMASEFLLTDFKWDAGSENFRGREKELREHYLGLFLELVLAEIVQHHANGLPSSPVDLTCTYPLRSNDAQVKSLSQSLDQAIRRATASTGVQLRLQDDVGLFDESRAAQVASETAGEVRLVADLGGGTLDLFIAANDHRSHPLAEVADSARLGGNLLLRGIAREARAYLPGNGNWSADGSRAAETRLRAWVRSRGAAELFGLDAERPSFEAMNLYGFDKAAQANISRVLIDRYFRLIIDYLARNLVAYLVGEWYPNVPKKERHRLKISVQLRGNGWRLSYLGTDYASINRWVQDQVRKRVEELWTDLDKAPDEAPVQARHWDPVDRYPFDDPKVAPVRNVVGRATSHEEVKRRWYTHTLVDLEVMRESGAELRRWYSKVPFPTGGSMQVELKDVTPPVPLHGPGEDLRIEVRQLDASLQGRVNRLLKGEAVRDNEGNYRAPVGPAVWEALFECRELWPHKGGR